MKVENTHGEKIKIINVYSLMNHSHIRVDKFITTPEGKNTKMKTTMS
jgi:hypothetical protein